VHMDSLTERHRDVTSSGPGTDTGAQLQHVSGAQVVTPASAANTTGNSSSIPPQAQAQTQTTAEHTQTSSAPAPAEIIDPGHPSLPSDPAVHDHVDAVMGGK
jgi:hypothetical protein